MKAVIGVIVGIAALWGILFLLNVPSNTPVDTVPVIETPTVVDTPTTTEQPAPQIYVPTVYQYPTALCVDGTYSYSQNRSGTCSWHGGVAVWY